MYNTTFFFKEVGVEAYESKKLTYKSLDFTQAYANEDPPVDPGQQNLSCTTDCQQDCVSTKDQLIDI